MRYIDTGSRDPNSVLGTWLTSELTADVTEIRWQAGFFSAGALGLFAPTLTRLASTDGIAKGVVGSNDASTLRDDVRLLARLMGVPRRSAGLAVISYSGAFYHPKTYHIRRSDGTQGAYVGSANLTPPAMNGLHIEAGMLLDTREGDPEQLLNAVAAAVDAWFTDRRIGTNTIADESLVDELLDSGILCLVPAPRPRAPSSTDGSRLSRRPRLGSLVVIPSVAGYVTDTPPSLPEYTPVAGQSVPRADFPDYLLFDPDATSPTSGAAALSGANLPGGATGLVIRLNRDSARHFDDRKGTANLSVPVASLSTIRFGIYTGKYRRPRAEFGLNVRYLGLDAAIVLPEVATNIMAYGFAAGESGHGDVRLVMPAVFKSLSEAIAAEAAPLPTEGDVALLEWPTLSYPTFQLTLLDRRTALFELVRQTFERAEASGHVVGEGACWLMPDIAPTW